MDMRRAQVRIHRPRHRTIRLGAVALGLLVSPALRAQSPAPIQVTGTCDFDLLQARPAWRVVLNEGFDNDLSRWDIWHGGAFNQELQLYQPPNVSIAGGILRLDARREPARGRTNPMDSTVRAFEFTSGRIESREHYSASPETPAVKIQARIRLPRGYGLWPAFWTYGDPWPSQGEIDILEARSQDRFDFQTAYWYGQRAGTNDAVRTEVAFRSSADLTSCWHVYEVTWHRDSLVFTFDGREIETKRAGYIPAMFGKRQRVALNVAVGGHFFTDLDPSRIEPGAMLVDWVRVLVPR